MYYQEGFFYKSQKLKPKHQTSYARKMALSRKSNDPINRIITNSSLLNVGPNILFNSDISINIKKNTANQQKIKINQSSKPLIKKNSQQSATTQKIKKKIKQKIISMLQQNKKNRLHLIKGNIDQCIKSKINQSRINHLKKTYLDFLDGQLGGVLNHQQQQPIHISKQNDSSSNTPVPSRKQQNGQFISQPISTSKIAIQINSKPKSSYSNMMKHLLQPCKIKPMKLIARQTTQKFTMKFSNGNNNDSKPNLINGQQFEDLGDDFPSNYLNSSNNNRRRYTRFSRNATTTAKKKDLTQGNEGTKMMGEYLRGWDQNNQKNNEEQVYNAQYFYDFKECDKQQEQKKQFKKQVLTSEKKRGYHSYVNIIKKNGNIIQNDTRKKKQRKSQKLHSSQQKIYY